MSAPGQTAYMSNAPHTRRAFLAFLPAAAWFVVAGPRRAFARRPHPDPRPGITAARVLTREQLGEHARAAPEFDMIRQIPRIADGIRCQCDCDELEGNYSLLSCFEGDGMAGHCQVCREQARLVYRLHRQGRTLKEIRAAIDKRFG